MNTTENNTTPTTGVWGVLKQIVTINGFFGPGFFKDFSEGWKEGCAKAATAQHYIVDDDVDERGVENGVLYVADPYQSGLLWDDDNPMLNITTKYN